MTAPRSLDRRTLLAAGLLAPLTLVSGRARAQAATRFRGVEVDVSPLDRFGGGGARNLLAPALLAEMRKVFAPQIAADDRAAPVVVARITSLYMAPYDGAQTYDSFGGNDNIEGDGLVTARGQVLSSTHILTELPPTYSGSIVTENLDLIRYQSIAYQFAWWLHREMGF